MLIRLLTLGIVFLLLTSCSPSSGEEAAESNMDSQTQHAQPTNAQPADGFSDLPEAARRATRVGDPRPPAYWAVWNSCAPDNRAETAAANGGRAAGWYLVDDILADPGLMLGEHPLATCEAALTILEGSAGQGDQASQAIADLAAALLAAELNLNVGAETCPIAEEAVIGGQLVLSELGFQGDLQSIISTSEVQAAIPRLLELLEGYNSGELCR